MNLIGRGASAGVASGKAHIIKDIHKNGHRKFQEGSVLVTVMTTPDYLPLMKRAAAIVTQNGGITCHAAIVSREYGIPCVVGVGPELWDHIKPGSQLTIDGGRGEVEVHGI